LFLSHLCTGCAGHRYLARLVHVPVSETLDLRAKKVWVTGHNGMVGAALVRRLASESCKVVTVDRRVVDLTRQAYV
jgi:predicted amino acid dehydrogenase